MPYKYPEDKARYDRFRYLKYTAYEKMTSKIHYHKNKGYILFQKKSYYKRNKKSILEDRKVRYYEEKQIKELVATVSKTITYY